MNNPSSQNYCRDYRWCGGHVGTCWQCHFLVSDPGLMHQGLGVRQGGEQSVFYHTLQAILTALGFEYICLKWWYIMNVSLIFNLLLNFWKWFLEVEFPLWCCLCRQNAGEDLRIEQREGYFWKVRCFIARPLYQDLSPSGLSGTNCMLDTMLVKWVYAWARNLFSLSSFPFLLSFSSLISASLSSLSPVCVTYIYVYVYETWSIFPVSSQYFMRYLHMNLLSIFSRFMYSPYFSYVTS